MSTNAHRVNRRRRTRRAGVIAAVLGLALAGGTGLASAGAEIHGDRTGGAEIHRMNTYGERAGGAEIHGAEIHGAEIH